MLERICHQRGVHPTFASLALRNLIVLSIRAGDTARAGALLQTGLKKYPGYAELPYIQALLRVREERSSEAIECILKGSKRAEGHYVGSGGERSYRASYILGLVAELAGNQYVAFNHYRAAVSTQPVFEPALLGLLRLRLPASIVQVQQWLLFRLAWREPKYLQPVFYFLLLHRQFTRARRLLQLLPETALKTKMTDQLDDWTRHIPVIRRRSAAPGTAPASY